MTETEKLRRLLDERGVEYKDRDMYGKHVFHWGEPLHGAMFTDGGEWTELVVENASPEQAIAATLGDSVATGERQGVAKVYLVEVSDELIESWHPLGVYLSRAAAEYCAKSHQREEDGIMYFTRVVELKVVDA